MYHRILLLSLFVLFSHLCFSQAARNPRITFFTSATIENTHRLSNAIESSDIDINTGILFGGEIIISNVDKANKFGAGVIYQHKNKMIGSSGDYSFWPIYLFNRYDFIRSGDMSLGLYLNLGYNIFNTSDDYLGSEASAEGNIYYSIGFVNSIYKSIQLRLLYSTNTGKINNPGNMFLVRNKFISFGLGYNF